MCWPFVAFSAALLVLLNYWRLCRARRRGVSEPDIDLRVLPSELVDRAVAISLFEYRGENVFYVELAGYDALNVVYRSDGAYVGAPDGGLTGRGDWRLADWSASARFLRQIRHRAKE